MSKGKPPPRASHRRSRKPAAKSTASPVGDADQVKIRAPIDGRGESSLSSECVTTPGPRLRTGGSIRRNTRSRVLYRRRTDLEVWLIARSLGVFFPAFNEEDNIGPLLDEAVRDL